MTTDKLSNAPRDQQSFIHLGLCLGLCAAIAWAGGIIPRRNFRRGMRAWQSLVGPRNPVFPIAWSIFYVLIAVALWRLWDLHCRIKRGTPR